MVRTTRNTTFPFARRISALSPRVRVLYSLVAMGVYVLLVLALGDSPGSEVALLALFPVVAAALLLGLWGGLLASLAIMLVHAAQLVLSPGAAGPQLLNQNTLFGSLVLVLSGALVGMISDIGYRLIQELDERQRAKSELQASRERYRSLFEGVPVGLYRTTPEGEILDASPALVEMLGYPDLESLLEVPVQQIFVEGDVYAGERALIEEEGVVRGFEMRLRRFDGQIIWARDSFRSVRDSSGQVCYYEGSLEDISENKRMEEAEREQRILAEALRDTAAALTSTLQFDEVLDRILTNIGKVLPHDAANIMLLEGDTARLERSQGYMNDWREEDRRTHRFPLAEMPTLQKMARSGEPLAIPDTAVHPDWVDLPHSGWMRSYAGAPLRVHGQTVGFLSLNSATAGFYTPEKASRLQAFADQAAVAIENARFFGELQAFARQMALLNDITRVAISAPEIGIMLQRLADRLGELFTADGAYITLWDERREAPMPAAAYGPYRHRYPRLDIPPGEPNMTEAILRAGRVLVAEDFSNSPYFNSRLSFQLPEKSILGLPLIADGRWLGAALIAFSQMKRFSPDEIALGEQTAAQIALALSRAQLLESERQRTLHLGRANRLITAFSQIATQVAAAKDLEALMGTLGGQLMQLGMHCLVAWQEPGAEDLSVDYISLDGKALALAEKLAGRALRNSSLPRERFPYYDRVILNRQAVFSAALSAIPDTAFPGIRASIVDQVAQLLGAVPGNQGFFLPLAAGDLALGALWIWGPDLQESDLPAAVLFAGQAAVAMENARLYARIQNMAITDELTGLYNRRGLFEIGRREAERLSRFGRSLAAVMIDIDHFKQVNDTYSHAVGDQVLRSFAACCRSNVREIDIIGRMGGEEFIVLLPENDLARARRAAERLRQRIVANPILTEMGEVSVTVSMGVAAVSRETRDLAELIRRADQALYIAKNSGRNRVAAFGGGNGKGS